jgi:hypothetical protein
MIENQKPPNEYTQFLNLLDSLEKADVSDSDFLSQYKELEKLFDQLKDSDAVPQEEKNRFEELKKKVESKQQSADTESQPPEPEDEDDQTKEEGNAQKQSDIDSKQLIELLKELINQDNDTQGLKEYFDEIKEFVSSKSNSLPTEISDLENLKSELELKIKEFEEMTSKAKIPFAQTREVNQGKTEAFNSIERILKEVVEKITTIQTTVASTKPVTKIDGFSHQDEYNNEVFDETGIKIPNEKTLWNWINVLFQVAANPTKPIHFNQEAFEHVQSPMISDIYTKWTELQVNIQTLKNANKLPPGYWSLILLIKSKIGFYNLYYDVREPNGANDHQKIMERILDGQALQYGPLVGGQDRLDDLLSYFGLTAFSKENKKKHVDGEDVIDVIRKTALDIMDHKYMFLVRDKQSKKLRFGEYKDAFNVGRMGGEYYIYLNDATRQGKYETDDEEVFLLKLSPDDKKALNKKLKEISDLKQKAEEEGRDLIVDPNIDWNESTGHIDVTFIVHGKNDVLSFESKKFPGIEKKLQEVVKKSLENQGVHDVKESMKNIFEVDLNGNINDTSKMKSNVFGFAWNLVALDLVDLAFIKKRARGSSVAQGNENLVGGAITMGEQKVSCLTDALSWAASIGYVMNNKPELATPEVDGLLLYKDNVHSISIPNELKDEEEIRNYIENNYQKCPLASSISPTRVGEFVEELKEYYKCFFTEEQIRGYNEEDNLFGHIEFNPNDQVWEFPSLSIALQRKYIDSTGAYYTALSGYLYMREHLFEELPDTLTDSQIRKKISDWLSNGPGKYKIIYAGQQENLIKKATRLYITRLVNKYDKNTPDNLQYIGQVESLIFETIFPIWTAGTVKDMKTDDLDYKIDLILDMFNPKMAKVFDDPEKRKSLKREFKFYTNRKKVIDYIKSQFRRANIISFFSRPKNMIHGRYQRHDRTQQTINYNLMMWEKHNLATNVVIAGRYKIHAAAQRHGAYEPPKPVPPRLMVEKSPDS